MQIFRSIYCVDLQTVFILSSLMMADYLTMRRIGLGGVSKLFNGGRRLSINPPRLVVVELGHGKPVNLAEAVGA